MIEVAVIAERLNRNGISKDSRARFIGCSLIEHHVVQDTKGTANNEDATIRRHIEYAIFQTNDEISKIENYKQMLIASLR